jgi:hypothetical protein
MQLGRGTASAREMKMEWADVVWVRNKEIWSGMLWFEPGIKRNLVYPEEIQCVKHEYDVIFACLENSTIITLSGYLLYRYRG